MIVALDVPTAAEAVRLARRLRRLVRTVKIGSVLFTRSGPDVIRRGGMVCVGVKVDPRLRIGLANLLGDYVGEVDDHGGGGAIFVDKLLAVFTFAPGPIVVGPGADSHAFDRHTMLFVAC